MLTSLAHVPFPETMVVVGDGDVIDPVLEIILDDEEFTVTDVLTFTVISFPIAVAGFGSVNVVVPLKITLIQF